LLPDKEAGISLFVLFRQFGIAGSVCIESGGAVLLRTGDFLHDTNLVDEIIVQASFTKKMLAVTYSSHLV
jgi:hypothetical protein